MGKENNRHLITYDNQFTKVSLHSLTIAQNSFLHAILSVGAREGVLSSRGTCLIKVTYKRLREITKRPNASKREIDDTIKNLHATTVELRLNYISDDCRYNSKLFENIAIQEGRSKGVQIELSLFMTKMISPKTKENTTTINVSEISSIKSPYGQELYRQLKKSEEKCKLTLTPEQWRDHFKTPNHFTDYDVIRSQITPAIDANKCFFKNLRANVKVGDKKLPSSLRFTFKYDRPKYMITEIRITTLVR